MKIEDEKDSFLNMLMDYISSFPAKMNNRYIVAERKTSKSKNLV